MKLGELKIDLDKSVNHESLEKLSQQFESFSTNVLTCP